MTTQAGLVVSYDYPLVALSIFIAILAAYAALDLAGRITTSRGFNRLAWLGCGAIAMGSGIWSMHYVGMEAFSLSVSVPVLYDWRTVLFSLLCAILASGTALFIVSQPTMGLHRKVIGSIVMGSGIAAMHYTGMAAMRLPAMCVYSSRLVVLSVILAIAISYIALRIAFVFRNDLTSWSLHKAGGALVLGLAIPVTHYSGMAAVTFMPTATVEGGLRHAVKVSDISLACIILITLILLVIVFVSAWVHRHLIAEVKQFEDNYLQLQAVFDSMTDAILVADFEAKTITHNQAAVRILGLEKKLISFAEAQDMYETFSFSGELVPLSQTPLARAGRGDYSTNAEMVIRNKENDTTASTEMTTVPLTDSQSKSPKVIMSIRDVAERRALEDNYLQLQAIFDGMTDAVIVADFEAKTILHNQAAVKLMGLEKKLISMEGVRDDFEVFLPSGEPVSMEQSPLMQAARGEYCINLELVFRNKTSGMTATTELTTVPLANSLGKKPNVIMSVRDVGARRIVDENRTRLAAIVESSEDAIIGENYEGIVTSWNKGAEKIFCYTAEEMIGQPLHKLLPPALGDEENVILRTIRESDVIKHFQSVRVRKDGHSIHVWLTISPILDAYGKVIGSSTIARDITTRMKLERQLQQSQKMDAIGQLTGGIAHDFNNLLGIVIGNLDLLERYVSGDDAALRQLQTAQKASLRGADLIRRLLAFSCNESLSPALTDLHDVIDNIIEMTGRVIGPEIKVKVHFEDSISEILVDAAGLESALVNLMVNARDAMPKGGTIAISTKFCKLEDTYPSVQAGEVKPGWYACVTMSDTGIGMSRQTLEHVFEPFFSTKPRGKGTGLGLAMVYGFVKQSHGTILIYSELDYGTTITLYLPVGDDVPQQVGKLVEPITTFTGTATVLVVDDELELLEIGVAYLASMGWKAFTAANGKNALLAIEREGNIDLLITDVIMPGGMNGVELAQKARALNPKIKVIYCSGFPADALTEHGMPMVDGPLLHKPYQRAEFSALARHVMATES